MKKRDHRKLAEFFMNAVGDKLPLLYRVAFVYGCYEPDINYLTYLHGFRTCQKFHGHNCGNISPVLTRMLRKDAGKRSSLRRWYRLGKCCHYAADTFTYPHNDGYTGTLQEHYYYELEVHRQLNILLKSYVPTITPQSDSAQNQTILLKNMHSRYLSENHTPANDCKYIVAVTQALLEYALPAADGVVGGTYADIAPRRARLT